MKVNRHSQSHRGHTKSQKWKDVRGKRCRPPVSASELDSTPVVARMIKEHHVSTKKKPSVKRLKSKAKSVSDARRNAPPQSGQKKHAHANGSSAFTPDNESDDSQEWKEFSRSVHGNGVDATDEDVEEEEERDVQPGRLEGKALHYCAERDDRKNHAVLVMQRSQVGHGERSRSLGWLKRHH